MMLEILIVVVVMLLLGSVLTGVYAYGIDNPNEADIDIDTWDNGMVRS